LKLLLIRCINHPQPTQTTSLKTARYGMSEKDVRIDDAGNSFGPGILTLNQHVILDREAENSPMTMAKVGEDESE